ncbi:GspMb/PilO family protein [Cognatiyoonia sp. IB215446]|uniref:GspMb/PilO family protein n=1 Tax=Cognatiyoonia sp. IB215446 TaxID=3097355 RepID=UPI002A165AE8|nr:GspMb/PilO family protein [Cognatiyoonia sp. IB215446]MDX8350552.1 GspMb/PilO family protein [Cognatiyoonia sp. IB215446]
MSAFVFQKPNAVRRFGVGLIIVTCILCIVLAAALANLVTQRYARIAELNDTVARAERVAMSEAQENTAFSLYQSETPQLSQAEMQSDMQELAQAHTVSLEVIRADQIETLPGNVRLALTLNGVVPEEQLGAYLVSIANHDPMIVVDSIDLRRARTTNRALGERPLAIQLKLSGFATR